MPPARGCPDGTNGLHTFNPDVVFKRLENRKEPVHLTLRDCEVVQRIVDDMLR